MLLCERRAPYDNIYTSAGISLRRLAAELPSEVFISAVEDEYALACYTLLHTNVPQAL